MVGGDGAPLDQRCLPVQLVVRAQTPGEVELILTTTRPEQVATISRVLGGQRQFVKTSGKQRPKTMVLKMSTYVKIG